MMHRRFSVAAKLISTSCPCGWIANDATTSTMTKSISGCIVRLLNDRKSLRSERDRNLHFGLMPLEVHEIEIAAGTNLTAPNLRRPGSSDPDLLGRASRTRSGQGRAPRPAVGRGPIHRRRARDAPRRRERTSPRTGKKGQLTARGPMTTRTRHPPWPCRCHTRC